VILDQNLKYLPYRRGLLEPLRECQQLGRKLVLATPADLQTVTEITEQLGLFAEVHRFERESDPGALGVRDRLANEYGEKGFDCLGDSDAQTAVLKAANTGYLVDVSLSTIARTRGLENVTVVSRQPSLSRALVSQLRPHQWAKNSLVLLPAMLAPAVPNASEVARGALTFVTFSFCASAGYVFNDLLDIEADRMHATKYRRPFASGALPTALGLPLFATLLALSVSLTWTYLPRSSLLMLGLYFLGTLGYSLYLKRVCMLDVLLLAGLYTLRILAGGIATGIKVSTWLLGFSMFLFTSLAFAKRYVELRPLSSSAQVKNRGYSGTDTAMVASMGTSSGFISALVFTLYVDSAAVRVNYREPAFLWLVLPILLYWLGRIWLLAGRGQMRDDPVKFALKDRLSLVSALLIGLVMAAARYTPGWLSQSLH
jgi:4-hydroxybenzoate polyprenyltransferase